MAGVRLEPDRSATGFPQQQSQIDQGIQLAMCRSRTRAGLTGDLAQVKPFVGMPEYVSKQPGPGTAEQGIRQRRDRCRSHIENKCTQTENILQHLDRTGPPGWRMVYALPPMDRNCRVMVLLDRSHPAKGGREGIIGCGFSQTCRRRVEAPALAIPIPWIPEFALSQSGLDCPLLDADKQPDRRNSAGRYCRSEDDPKGIESGFHHEDKSNGGVSGVERNSHHLWIGEDIRADRCAPLAPSARTPESASPHPDALARNIAIRDPDGTRLQRRTA